jgi:hypothetical protein
MDINYALIKKYTITYLEICEDYLLEVNWGYVSIGMFCLLLLFFTVDSLTGSQISPGFLIVVLFILVVLGFIVNSMFGSMG